MDFYAGDIVRSLITDGVGLEKGELGTVINVNVVGDPYIHLDKYNKNRHNGYGDIPVGHGWFVSKKCLERVGTLDLGELPENNNIKFLFGENGL